jgi:hypothetical protein
MTFGSPGGMLIVISSGSTVVCPRKRYERKPIHAISSKGGGTEVPSPLGPLFRQMHSYLWFGVTAQRN